MLLKQRQDLDLVVVEIGDPEVAAVNEDRGRLVEFLDFRALLPRSADRSGLPGLFDADDPVGVHVGYKDDAFIIDGDPVRCVQ